MTGDHRVQAFGARREQRSGDTTLRRQPGNTAIGYEEVSKPSARRAELINGRANVITRQFATSVPPAQSVGPTDTS